MSPERRRALITGLTGQDGSFLAELLLADGYEVIGLVRGRPDDYGDRGVPDAGGRPGEPDPLGCAQHLRGEVRLIGGDLVDPESLVAAVQALEPHEIYHLAAPTFVPESWQDPGGTMSAIAVGTAALLQAVARHSPRTRLLVAGSGEMFGDAPESPQHEDTPCRPRTPYAAAKLAAHQLVGLMREHTGVFACSAILYNHESERRPANFVTRKITRAAASIKLGLTHEVTLGDTGATRDWSYAPDILRGCRLMLGHQHARDYILSSGVGHTVQELVETAFAHLGLDPARHVRIDPSLVRGPERTKPIGDPGRARDELGWRPTLTFEQLITRMVDADLAELSGVSTAPPS